VRSTAAVLGVVVALAAFVLAWLVLRPSRHAEPAPATTQPPPGAGLTPSSRKVSFPLTAEERERTELALRRRPFLENMTSVCGNVGAHCRVGKDLDTLEILLPSGSSASFDYIRDKALALGPQDHGFRRIRFLERRQEGDALPPTLVAEVTLSEDGHWVTFLR